MTSGKRCILLVDDDADFRMATRQILESEGFEVHEAPNLAEGFAAARTVRPEVILIDVIMDTYTEGFDLVRQLATDPITRDIPRILLSTLRLMQEMDTVFPKELGTANILQKPVPARELLAAIDDACAGARTAAVGKGG